MVCVFDMQLYILIGINKHQNKLDAKVITNLENICAHWRVLRSYLKLVC
jgi:hypothetical protein